MFEAKVRGKGHQMIHEYFPSIRYPALVHRLCKAEGRLYTMGSLRPRPDEPDPVWGRKCPECTRIKTKMQSEAPEPLVGVL